MKNSESPGQVVEDWVPEKIRNLVTTPVNYHVMKGDIIPGSDGEQSITNLAVARDGVATMALARMDALHMRRYQSHRIPPFGNPYDIKRAITMRPSDDEIVVLLTEDWNRKTVIHEYGHILEMSLVPFPTIMYSGYIFNYTLSAKLLSDFYNSPAFSAFGLTAEQIESFRPDLMRLTVKDAIEQSAKIPLLNLLVQSLLRSKLPFNSALGPPTEYFAEAFASWTGIPNDRDLLEDGPQNPALIDSHLITLFNSLKETGAPDTYTQGCIDILKVDPNVQAQTLLLAVGKIDSIPQVSVD